MWKGYESKSTLEMNVNEIFSDFQCWYDNCSLVGKSGVNFLVIVRCDEFFQKKTSCYILLSVCIVFSGRSFFFFFFHLQRSTSFHGKSSYACRILNRVTSRRV